MALISVFASQQILFFYYSPIYAFLCRYFANMIYFEISLN